jgi:hypothetical protein
MFPELKHVAKVCYIYYVGHFDIQRPYSTKINFLISFQLTSISIIIEINEDIHKISRNLV